jgi:hypothetical protein
MYTRTVTILKGERFTLDNIGNGLAYVLTDTLEGLEAFAQGDDADYFAGDLAAVQRRNPEYTPDQICDVLWDIYDYRKVAGPVGWTHVTA